MAHTQPISTPNRLLAALPHKDREQLLTRCTSVELNFGDVLCLPGDRIPHLYFPTGGFISLVAPIDGYAALEVGMIGDEGMFGTGVTLGVDSALVHALVQGAGPALRISPSRFRLALKDSPALRARLKRYTYVLLSQLVQVAACTRFHVVEARLARWLLMTHDRSHADAFYLTQEFLSHMLGVRRSGVSNAAGALQKRKVISYNRGIITILDRRALEAAACGCYRSDQETYHRILG